MENKNMDIIDNLLSVEHDALLKNEVGFVEYSKIKKLAEETGQDFATLLQNASDEKKILLQEWTKNDNPQCVGYFATNRDAQGESMKITSDSHSDNLKTALVETKLPGLAMFMLDLT